MTTKRWVIFVSDCLPLETAQKKQEHSIFIKWFYDCNQQWSNKLFTLFCPFLANPLLKLNMNASMTNVLTVHRSNNKNHEFVHDSKTPTKITKDEKSWSDTKPMTQSCLVAMIGTHLLKTTKFQAVSVLGSKNTFAPNSKIPSSVRP